MDDSEKPGSRLEVSISFGRFENDALSWEKWSSFSPNKYLEEVGSLSTPGSVAQKKAYFEAHYKKIAARKAEEELEQEQEQFMNPVSSKEDQIANASEDGIEFSLSSDERLVGEAVEEAADNEKESSGKSFKEDEHVCRNSVVDNIVSEEEMGASVAVQADTDECVSGANVDGPELNAVLETPRKDLKAPPESKNGLKQSSAPRKENSKLNSRNMAQKVTPNSKERSLPGTRKKVVPSPAKPSPATTTRRSKPTSISTPASAPQSLKKKVNNSAPPKRVAPTSLHMSLSLGRGDPPGALPVTRKSLIMESMGDKDIVKRAFKTFQNRTNGFATDEKLTTVKHVSTASCETKTPNYRTPTRGSEGLRKDSEKKATQRSLTGTRSNPLSSGLRKSIGLDRKTPATLSTATGLRNDEKAEKRRELVKKLGAKSLAREAEKAKLGVDATSKVSLSLHERDSN